MKNQHFLKAITVIFALLILGGCASTSPKRTCHQQVLSEGTKFDGDLSYAITLKCNDVTISVESHTKTGLYNYKAFFVINGQRVDFLLKEKGRLVKHIKTTGNRTELEDGGFESMMCLLKAKTVDGKYMIGSACDDY